MAGLGVGDGATGQAGLAAGANGRALGEGSASGDWAGAAAAEPIRLKPKGRAAIFDHVSEYIRREPAQSTRLLETWIGSPEGTK
jgi:hypothetical protein